jgi:hypothetical protein
MLWRFSQLLLACSSRGLALANLQSRSVCTMRPAVTAPIQDASQMFPCNIGPVSTPRWSVAPCPTARRRRAALPPKNRAPTRPWQDQPPLPQPGCAVPGAQYAAPRAASVARPRPSRRLMTAPAGWVDRGVDARSPTATEEGKGKWCVFRRRALQVASAACSASPHHACQGRAWSQRAAGAGANCAQLREQVWHPRGAGDAHTQTTRACIYCRHQLP